jgi:CheY-like chemotaxis protein
MIRREQLDPTMLNRLDIYALGAIAYELLTTTPAFQGDSAETVLEAQASGVFPALSEVRPELPPAFDGVISKSMALDPKDRHSTVDEFKRDLFAARHAVLAKVTARRIVVIDDNRSDLELALKILKGRFKDALLMAFESPTAALNAISADPPSLIVCDLRMDAMDGLRVVQAIRSAAEFNHVPIIMVSAEGGGRDWRNLKQAGADGYLMKPLDPVTLGALVESLLESPMRIRGARERED